MKEWSPWLGSAVLVFLLAVSGCIVENPPSEVSESREVFTVQSAGDGREVDMLEPQVADERPGREINFSKPQVSQVAVESLGPVRLVNRVKLAESGGVAMLQYYEKGNGEQGLYFSDRSSSTHVFLPEFKGIQSDRVDFRGTRFDQAEHVLTTLDDVWIFSEAATDVIDTRLGYMSPVLISHYALNGSFLPTSAFPLSSMTFGDDHSRTGAFIGLRSGGMIASWYQSYVVNPHDDRRLEIGIAYRDPRGHWSTLFPIEVDGTAGGGIPQSRQALVQHPADGSIWLFNKRDSYHSMEMVHMIEMEAGIAVNWIDPLFINEMEHREDSVEAEFPGIVAIPDPVRKVIVLAYGDNRFEMTTCGGTCFRKVTHVTVVIITADGTPFFETHSSFTIERTTRFGMALDGDTLWFAYKPHTLSSTPPLVLELIAYDLRTGS